MPALRVAFLVPGPLEQPTGGYRYDREMLAGLTERGWRVDVHALAGRFPYPDGRARESLAEALAAIPSSVPLLADGLTLAALAAHRRALDGRRLLVLLHHPAALERGLGDRRLRVLAQAERQVLALADGVLTTSRQTLDGLDYPPGRARVVHPGVDAPARRRRRQSGPQRLLSVASVTPRKGHDVLLQALAGLTHLPWFLTCIGDLDRDPRFAARVQARAGRLGLGGRIRFAGAVDGRQLARAYARADLFVSASFHEGFGMAAAEALAHGVPVLATRVGGLVEALPPPARLWVPRGDAGALRRALGLFLTSVPIAARLERGARYAAKRRRSWNEAREDFERALRALLAIPLRGRASPAIAPP